MKPRAIDIVTHGSLGGTKVAMEFDSHSIAHIMSVLTDLYSDPELAIVREYATNAYDSHIAAGCDKPIEVSTGSALSPFFVVQDFGLGLSVDELIDTYSKYGASTKRNTDEQVGMLGLGSKSALTYANQFTVIAVKNGIKTTVLISRDETGQGIMEIIDTVACNESNGVTIKIPVKRNSLLVEKAMNFFRYWPSGSVLLNGRLHEFSIPADAIQVDDDTWVVKNEYSYRSDPDVIIMGNIPYALGNYGAHNNTYHIIHCADIGAIDFAPNREQLHYTRRTNDYINGLREYVAGRVKAVIKQQINAKPSKHEAIRMLFNNADMFNRSDVVLYHGVKIPTQIDYAWAYDLNRKREPYKYGINAAYITRDRLHGNHHFLMERFVLIANAPAELTPYERQKLRRFMGHIGKQNALVTGTDIHNPWLSYDYDWQQIKDWCMPSTQRAASGRKPFMLATKHGFEPIFAEDIDPAKPVYLLETNDESIAIDACSIIGEQVVYVSPNRVDKFKRDFPLAIGANEKIQQISTNELGQLTDEQFLHIRGLNREYMAVFGLVKAKDPELAWASRTVSQRLDSQVASRLWLLVSQTHYNRDISSLTQRIKNVLDMYPLLEPLYRSYGKRFANEMYDYVNALYENRSKQNEV